MLKPIWFREILRNSEDEGGGGGASDDEGVVEEDRAPDRTSQIEARLDRLDRLGNTIQGWMERSEKSQRETQAQQLENQIKGAETKAAKDLDDAEKKLAEAFDEGDGAAIARAQRTVAEAAARRERINVAAQQARDQIKANERKTPEQRGQGGGADDDLDTTNLDNWKKSNASWYGIDSDMTKAAHSIDASIRTAGVLEPGSSQYFEAVDRQMRQKFPDRFEGSPQTGGGSGGSTYTGGGNNRQQTRIPATVAEGYRRMGIDIDDPEVAKRMVANREIAVRKGWLPEKPNMGRILQR